MTVSKAIETESIQTAEWIDVINPVTQAPIGQIPVTGEDGILAAIDRARAAQGAWAALSIRERTRYFRRWLDLLWARQQEAIDLIRKENGKASNSAYIELIMADNVVQYYIHHAQRILKSRNRRSLFPGIQRGRIHFKPHGVVGIISPWNYPFALPFMDLSPALIAGNSVILKPSEIAPLIAQWGVALMHEAGIPPDVVQVVHGDGRTGAKLVEHVDCMHFTGSTAVGRQVAVRCAERLIPYTLELGGKDPAIVLADADPEMTAIGLMQGAFENAGQVCISVERVYVEEAIYEPLLEQIQKYAEQIKIGITPDMDIAVGSMTNRTEYERTIAHIQDAVSKGAKVIYGGRPRPEIGPLVHEPTVLIDVDHSMVVMSDESFGPILPIMKVRDVNEAIRLANDTNYGLSASIFTKNLKQAEQVALQIDSGDVNVNRPQYATGTPALATGGQRDSGMGRRNGPEGLLKYTVPQSIMLDTLIGAEKSLVVATPFAIRIMTILRQIRRYISFI